MVVSRDPEVLFKEARRRTRRRRVLAAGFVAAIAGAAALIILIGSGAPATQAGPRGRSGPASSGGPTVPLKSPGPLAVSPRGTLYVVDDGSDRILRLLPSGKFAVFAGSSRVGFSGDGGPATRADLHGVSTIAVGPGGTVYIADTDNNRVRAVAPDGTIRTLVRVSRPTGLAVGPHDRLYIGANFLFWLPLAGGRLRRLAGWNGWPPRTNRELLESHFSNASGDIAVDSKGDVFEANFPQLYERTAAGRLRFLGNGFRATGAGILADGPGYTVYEGTFGVARVSSAAPGSDQIVQRPRSIIPARLVDAAVGGDWRRLATVGTGAILAPAMGLAVAGNGTIYYDTDSGDGWVSGALIAVNPGGRVHVIWRAPR